MAVIDLLADGATQGLEVIAKSNRPMTKDQYLSLQYSRLTEESYVGE